MCELALIVKMRFSTTTKKFQKCWQFQEQHSSGLYFILHNVVFNHENGFKSQSPQQNCKNETEHYVELQSVLTSNDNKTSERGITISRFTIFSSWRQWRRYRQRSYLSGDQRCSMPGFWSVHQVSWWMRIHLNVAIYYSEIPKENPKNIKSKQNITTALLILI